jgi:pimeloyl-ACP methyl ester carboxylesterase
MNLSGKALLPFQLQEKLFTTSLSFTIPYYVIQGREDVFTPTDPALAYFKHIKAPKKKSVVIEGAGHFALVTHKHEFIEALNSMLSTNEK